MTNISYNKRVKARVITSRIIAQDAREVVFEVDDKNFKFVPGQYVHVYIPELKFPDPRGNHRDFSIASLPGETKLKIAFRDSGSGFKRTLSLIDENLDIEITGPFGNFVLPKKLTRPIIFIAGGVGVTPFFSMISELIKKKTKHPLHLLYVNSNQKRAIYLKELKEMAAKNANFTLQEKYSHLNEADLRDAANLFKNPVWYLAGPPHMVAKKERILLLQGISDKDIYKEEFSGYVQPDNIQSDSTDELPFDLQRPFDEVREIKSWSHSELEAILNALNNSAIVSVTNADGAISYVNDKFIEISKYSRDELIGQSHRILKSNEHPPEFYQQMWNTIRSGKVWRGEIRNIAKDGSHYWVDTSIAPIFNSRGIPEKYYSVRFPITERKENAIRLQQLNTELESTNKELKEFVYIVSHDLQEPLRKILTFGRILENDLSKSISDKQQIYLARLQGAAFRMKKLINDLLTYSRVAGQEFGYSKVDLSEITREVVDDLEIPIQELEAKIVVNKLPTIEANATLMRLLVQNLLSNALKFHRDGIKPSVRFYSSKTTKEDSVPSATTEDEIKFCRIYIKDNGIGFDEKYKEQIFTIFERLHNVDEYDGTGIGLAVVKKIVQRHNGDIQVSSQIGKGTTFMISLPVAQ